MATLRADQVRPSKNLQCKNPSFFINWLDPLDLFKLKKLLDMCCLCPGGTREGMPYFFLKRCFCETHYLTILSTDCRNFSWQTFSRKVQLVLAHPSLHTKSCNACEWIMAICLLTMILASSPWKPHLHLVCGVESNVATGRRVCQLLRHWDGAYGWGVWGRGVRCTSL